MKKDNQGLIKVTMLVIDISLFFPPLKCLFW
jgi:hypothetical protein